MEKRWTEEFKIGSHDVDFNGTARASNLLRYHQETAHRQLEAIGPREESLRAQNQAFLLSRLSMRFFFPLFEGDRIKVQTWGCESRGASFFRCGQIFSGEKCAAEVVSAWALMDFAKGRLVRVSDALPGFPVDEFLEEAIPVKFRIPPETEMASAGDYRVGYGVTDRNRHMNNTFYPDLLCDAYPGGMEGRWTTAFSISYIKEAPLGSRGEIFVSQPDEKGLCYYRTKREDGTPGIEAYLQTAPLAPSGGGLAGV